MVENDNQPATRRGGTVLRRLIPSVGTVSVLGDLSDHVPARRFSPRLSRWRSRRTAPSEWLGTRLSSLPGSRSIVDRALGATASPLAHAPSGVPRHPGDAVPARLQDCQTTTPEYFVGLVPDTHDALARKLTDSALGVSYVSLPKSLPADGPTATAASSWVYRSWPLAHFQLHIVCFEIEAGDGPAVLVYCHHEPNWLRHPLRHLSRRYLNPAWGKERTRAVLDDAGVECFPSAARECTGVARVATDGECNE